MMYISTKVWNCALGLTAASLAFGGVQFGMASDYAFIRDAQSIQQDGVNMAVNRFAKVDRDAWRPTTPTTTSTLVYQLSGLQGTSIALRLPAGSAKALSSNNAGMPKFRSHDISKVMTACEPVVSRLAAAAKELGSGRCIT